MDFDPVMISMVRKIAPLLLAEDITGVQPMKGDLLNNVLNVKVSSKEHNPVQGELIHDLMQGCLRYYGTEYIPVSLWTKIKLTGL